MPDQYVFPQDVATGVAPNIKEVRMGGLTLRQLFAAQALLGIMSSQGNTIDGKEVQSIKDVAKAAWMAADAMLETQ